MSINPIVLALIAVGQIALLAVITGFIASRKEKRDAERAIEAAKQAAKLKSDEKAEDWRRQDEVAERVAVAAKQAADAALLLVEAQKETIARTDEVARVQAESDKRIGDQLLAIDEQGKKIHILVNSDMTAARTNERNQTMLTVLALKRVQALSRKLGLPVDVKEEESIVTAEGRIEELNQILADRLAAQHKVDAESAKKSVQ
jgi:hypothetical protein